MRSIRSCLLLLLGIGIVTSVLAEDPPGLWKDYDNAFMGLHLRVKREWTEIEMKETKDTGSVAFGISLTEPQSRVYALRQKTTDSFDVWMSSETLSQIYQPGYQRSGPVTFAGRRSIKIVGISINDPKNRKEETYYSSQPPYIDQITFAAPQENGALVEPDFEIVRKSIRWTR